MFEVINCVYYLSLINVMNALPSSENICVVKFLGTLPTPNVDLWNSMKQEAGMHITSKTPQSPPLKLHCVEFGNVAFRKQIWQKGIYIF